MEYLGEETIKTVINLANRCYLPYSNTEAWVNPFDEKEIEEAFKPRPEIEKLEEFIDDLSDEEKSELMALMWLGRDGGQWDFLLNHARGEIDDAGRYMAEKDSLATYLERGIERAKKINLL